MNAQHAIENMSVSGIDEPSQGNVVWQNVQTFLDGRMFSWLIIFPSLFNVMILT
jgi:hypothetical protein